MNANLKAFGVFCLCAATAACGEDSGDSQPDPAASEAQIQSIDVDGCTFNQFQLDITEGPSAGLTVEGKLFLAKDASTAGGLSGGFLWNGQHVAVTGAYTDDNIALHVDLGDGRFVEGYGPITGGNYCAAVEGVALGPTSAPDNSDPAKFDQGHWLALSPDYLEPIQVDIIFDPFGTLTLAEGDYNTLNITQECKDKAKTACACCSVGGTDSCRIKAGNNCDAGQTGNIAQDSAGNMFRECTASGVLESIQQIGCKLGLVGPLKN